MSVLPRFRTVVMLLMLVVALLAIQIVAEFQTPTNQPPVVAVANAANQNTANPNVINTNAVNQNAANHAVGLNLPPPLPVIQIDNGQVAATSQAALAELQARAVQYRTTRVIIGLDTNDVMGDALRTSGTLSTPQAIQAAQQRFLGQMDAFFTDDIVTYRNIPYLALTVDVHGLIALAQSPLVASIEEDRPIEPMLDDSVPLVGGQNAWAKGYTGKGQAVVIIDTGVDKYHPFLEGSVVSEACYSFEGDMFGINFKTACPGGGTSETGNDTGLPCEGSVCNHGTHVAGIVAGKNGVAPEAGIVAIKVTAYPENCGRVLPCAYLISSGILAGLDRAYELRNELNVASVNMSLGTGITWYGHCDGSDTGYMPLVKNLLSVGTATVVASGNGSRSNGLSSPACLSETVSVGASDKSDGIAKFSNISPILDLYAPGVSITSSVPGGEMAAFNGTSMAAPHVAGAWAILKQAKPDASVDEVLMALQSTGVMLTDTRTGQLVPRIQVDKAVEAILAGIPARPKIIINEVNAEGRQWIELYNADTVTVDLNGWKLHFFNADSTLAGDVTFGTGVQVAPGGYVVIYTQCGSDIPAAQCLGNISWKTDGGGAVQLSTSLIAADYVRWGSVKQRPATGTYWIDPDPTAIPAGAALGRDANSTETDQGSDWKPTQPTPGSANIRKTS